jgi:hypothetical protein
VTVICAVVYFLLIHGAGDCNLRGRLPLIHVAGDCSLCGRLPLKVPKREIFDRSDFPDFYTIKSSWVGDLLVKILTYYFNF